MPTQTSPTTETATQFYTWKNYKCAYEFHIPTDANNPSATPLLLIHPIGVGLSRHFWQRFCTEWYKTGHSNPIYNPDLLGCGNSDMPHVACTPRDWAEQLQYFLQNVVKQPVIIIVQGALLPVAIELVNLQNEPNLISALVMAGPPALPLITKNSPPVRQRVRWNILDSPFGKAFYRYARRPQFLDSFSIRQLFADEDSVDAEWLDTLVKGAANPDSRHAVFSFLAGFWRQDYKDAIAAIKQPTLVVLGEEASSISKKGKEETPDERLAEYLQLLPNSKGMKIPGRNVLPYESTAEFIAAIADFVGK